jgi:DNA polymerase-3 subunit gamma/tau
MGQALYRKYRSKSLAEIVGQEHITDTLSQALKKGKLSHAYLFTGPRGTGKTSIARILAHEVNGLPYNHEDNHIDIIEIDAASNRGIDEIRDLREKVYAAPVSAKYKVYIIDEVHMLTTPAFNALLKTLEEPPEHVIFILATTEAHKLPETIISRTQRHVFRPVAKDKVIAHLKAMAKSEGIKIDDEALAVIAEHGGGTFRDSISLLDQAGGSSTKITKSVAEALLGVPPKEQLEQLLAAVQAGDAAVMLGHLEALQTSGFHPANIAKKLGEILRGELITSQPRFGSTKQLALLGSLLEVAPAHEPLRKLELCLLAALPAQAAPYMVVPPVPASRPMQPETKSEKKATAKTPAEPEATVVSEPDVLPGSETVETPSDTTPPVPNSTELMDSTSWQAVLDTLKKTHNTLYGVMRMAVPEFEPGLLRLRFQFAFHQKRMNEAKHRSIVVGIVEQITGNAMAIECVHDKEALVGGPVGTTHPTTEAPDVAVTPGSLATISNIFGGGELLES